MTKGHKKKEKKKKCELNIKKHSKIKTKLFSGIEQQIQKVVRVPRRYTRVIISFFFFFVFFAVVQCQEISIYTLSVVHAELTSPHRFHANGVVE